jgi:ATP-dependent DNA helicase Rep
MSFPLNPAQREAVRYLDGPCLVLAGAGSGKTRVITAKIAHLVQSGQMKAENIAAITFTNKAAGEMGQRVRELIGKDAADKATICTFHSLGMRILRSEAKHVGIKPNFTILDAADSAAVVSDILSTTDKQLIRSTQTQISLWKNATLSPGQAADAAANEAQHQIAKVYARYNETVRAYQAVDFDDLIALPLSLFEAHGEVRERWQNKLRYLLVDEVQDTNAAQYALLKHITGPRAMFTAVGDDDQSIYGWRGATLDNLAAFGKRPISSSATTPSCLRKSCGANMAWATRLPCCRKTTRTPKLRTCSPACPRTNLSAAPSLPTTRFSTAATCKRACLKPRCGSRKFRMSSAAGKVFLTAQRSRMWWRTCA